MNTAEIRTAFLKFFEKNGHQIVQSSSLIPAGDPTLLFANSGMVQFKDTFLGTELRPYTRATTCQKSLRISGKHNDLENVGRTARHHTFFEMLGNFSFGDYFKADAIKFAWEFLTEILQLPKDRLWITIFEEDDEAEKLWSELTDVLPGRILRCGKEDNFWAMGETGPCGPCSEIHYFLGDDVKNQSEAAFRVGDGTYIEIWNLVFMQFNRDVQGKLNPLPKPSVDTGMGLERIAAVKQGVRANYDTDLLRNIISATEKQCSIAYDGKDYSERDVLSDRLYATDIAHRVIADHSRAAAFLIADGVLPGSDGRGFVLRRLIRRACRHGRELNFRSPFLFEITKTVINLMGDAYPELRANSDKILKLVRVEEEKFLKTLDGGLELLSKNIDDLKKKSAKALPGDIAFLLHDTFGFPLDLTQDIARISNIGVDVSGFEEKMSEQRERARSARASSSEQQLIRAVRPTKTEFVGYEFLEYESDVLSLFNETGELKAAREGDEIILLAKETPFYGESGGQLGDIGTISSNTATLSVSDTQKVGGDCYAHICKVIEGELPVGSRVRLKVDERRRNLLRANHSATHLLHLALREVLGEHVHQAGSRVSPNATRFDFSHFEAVSTEQLDEIERIVNAEIRNDSVVQTELMALDEAKKLGAMALFGEKYGSTVRVVTIGPRSRELCGGTHVSRAGEIGFFTLTAETAISSGVRRVEGSSGEGAILIVQEKKRLLSQVARLLSAPPSEAVSRLEKMNERIRELEDSVRKANQEKKKGGAQEVLARAAKNSKGVAVIAEILEGLDAKALREVADDLRVKLPSSCLLLSSIIDDKAIFLTAVTENLTKEYHAGEILKQVAAVAGSKGGGRADLAQAGGGDPAKIALALERFKTLVS